MTQVRRVLMVCLTRTPNQTGLQIGKGFERKGFDVFYHDYEKGSQSDLISLARRTRPDILFVTNGIGIGRRTYECLRPFVSKLVMWLPDAYLPSDTCYGRAYLADVLDVFDSVLVTCRGLTEPLSRHNPNTFFAPSFFDNHSYAVEGTTPEERSFFESDVVFIGNNQMVYGRERLSVLKAVSKICNLKIWGIGWGIQLPRWIAKAGKLGTPGVVPERGLRYRFWNAVVHAKPALRLTCFSRSVTGVELVDNSVAKAYGCSKIGLNAGSLNALGRGNIDLGFSNRLFNCMGCGTFYATPPIENINEWFQEGRDLVIYRSIKNLLSKIRYYLEDDAERKRIARNGYRKVMKNHTIDTRVSQYLQIIENQKDVFAKN